jgi:RNA polymerase sigma factor (sigma-70 family)
MADLTDHLPRLRRYARALTGDAAAADDLVQDTLERALSRVRLFRTGTRHDAWLLAIMHNLFVSQVRQYVAHPFTTSFDESDAAVRGTEADQLAVRDLDRALSQLSPEHRSVLLLISLEEISYEEAARVLNIPVGTVMSRLSRARDHLREILAGQTRGGAHLKVVK